MICWLLVHVILIDSKYLFRDLSSSVLYMHSSQGSAGASWGLLLWGGCRETSMHILSHPNFIQSLSSFINMLDFPLKRLLKKEVHVLKIFETHWTR